MTKFQKTTCKPNLLGKMKLHENIGWHDLSSRDHMVNWERYITTFTKTTITKFGWNTYANKMIPFLYVTWSRNLLELHGANSKKAITTKLGRNTYKNESINSVIKFYCKENNKKVSIWRDLHMTWPNHAKVFKATAPKVAFMKGTHLQRPRYFWLYEIYCLKCARIRVFTDPPSPV